MPHTWGQGHTSDLGRQTMSEVKMSIHTPIELNTCATKPGITVELVPASRLRPQRCEQDREAAERPGWGSNKPCFRPLLSYSDPLVSLTPFSSISVAATPPQGQVLFLEVRCPILQALSAGETPWLMEKRLWGKDGAACEFQLCD